MSYRDRWPRYVQRDPTSEGLRCGVLVLLGLVGALAVLLVVLNWI